MVLNLSWTEFKGIINSKNLNIAYRDEPFSKYTVYASDGSVTYVSLILDSADITDFENNFKAYANTQLLNHAKIVGDDGNYVTDVILKAGYNRLCTDSIVTVEEIFGQDRYADTWFSIDESAHNIGEKITVNISSKVYDSDTTFPAIAIDIVATATELYDPIAMAKLVVTTLNNNSSFNTYFKALKHLDNAIVTIRSKYMQEYGERTTFSTATTGSVATQDGYGDIAMRGKPTSLSYDRRDPRVGILGISGSVTVTPGAIADAFNNLNFEYMGSPDMNVVGSLASPIIFTIGADATRDIFVSDIRIYGQDNGIKYSNFLAAAALTNGIEIKVKSDNIERVITTLYTTADIKHIFSFPQTNFLLDYAPSVDDVAGGITFPNPFPLRKQGTFPVDDYVQFKVQDNLSSIIYLRALAAGFYEEV